MAQKIKHIRLYLKEELLKVKTALKKLIKIPIRTYKEKLRDLADMIAIVLNI